MADALPPAKRRRGRPRKHMDAPVAKREYNRERNRRVRAKQEADDDTQPPSSWPLKATRSATSPNMHIQVVIEERVEAGTKCTSTRRREEDDHYNMDSGDAWEDPGSFYDSGETQNGIGHGGDDKESNKHVGAQAANRRVCAKQEVDDRPAPPSQPLEATRSLASSNMHIQVVIEERVEAGTRCTSTRRREEDDYYNMDSGDAWEDLGSFYNSGET